MNGALLGAQRVAFTGLHKMLAGRRSCQPDLGAPGSVRRQKRGTLSVSSDRITKENLEKSRWRERESARAVSGACKRLTEPQRPPKSSSPYSNGPPAGRGRIGLQNSDRSPVSMAPATTVAAFTCQNICVIKGRKKTTSKVESKASVVITLMRLFITTFIGGFVLRLFATEIQKTQARVAGSTPPQPGTRNVRTCGEWERCPLISEQRAMRAPPSGQNRTLHGFPLKLGCWGARRKRQPGAALMWLMDRRCPGGAEVETDG